MFDSINTCCPLHSTASSRMARPTISTILSEKGFRGALFLTGEVLFIARPLIYVLFIRKYGIRSWAPWFLSLTIDCLANGILSLVSTTVAGEKQQLMHLSALEKDEVRVSLGSKPHHIKMHQAFGIVH